MHWGKEIIKDLLSDVEAGDLFVGLGFFVVFVFIMAIVAVNINTLNVSKERLEYKEVMEKYCGDAPDGELCKQASNKYFDIEERAITDSPLFGAAVTLVIVVLLILVFW